MIPRIAAFADLDLLTLYAILRLRVDVFVVEQASAYADLDGRDTEPGTRHLWVPDPDGDPGVVAAYLRMLQDPDGATRLGRIVTARAHRRRGYAGTLVEYALRRASGPVVLSAQAHLVEWYRRLGFEPVGAPYLDDGMPHLPMACADSGDA